MKVLFASFLLFVLMSTLNAQHGQHIKLYEGTIYNSKPCDFKEEVLSTGRTIHVTVPELIAFFPEKQDSLRTSVIICPGGGYQRLTMIHEGEEVAKELNKLGITAFVLKYRLPNDTCMTGKEFVPLADAQQAIHLVRTNAAKWNLNSEKVGVVGFSAGGHLAASLSNLYSYDLHHYQDSINLRPDFAVLIYPVISLRENIAHKGSRDKLLGMHPTEEMLKLFSLDEQVNAKTPPTFILLAADDKTVPPQNSIAYHDALVQHKIATEIHMFQNGGHGFGLHLPGNYVWIDLLKRWMGVNQL